MSTSKRACTGTTRKGKPCKAAALKGRDVCLAHADEETRISANFQQGPRPGRRPLPKPTELARQLVERHAAAILRPHFKALGLMLHDDGSTTPLTNGAIVVHQGEATTIEDLGAQIAAARELLDRVYGKPKQATEVTGADGGPIEHVTVPAGLDRAGEVASILQEAGVSSGSEASATNGGGHRTNGNGNGNGRH